MSEVIFKKEDHFTVVATDDGGGQISSQKVEALLLLAILEKLEEIRYCTIDVESAIAPR